MTKTVRALGLFSILCIGINAIVGSGIYRLPGRIAHHLGGASWAAFALVGVLLVAVGLCFAEAAGMFSSSGGPYVYTREAFGRTPAFVVGWMAWITMVLSWGAVAHGVVGYLGALVPVEEPRLARAVVIAMIVGPGLLNYFGVKPGAYATNAFTIAKLVPLGLFVVVGLAHVDWSLIEASPARVVDEGESWLPPFGAAMFAALFAVQGFEVAPVPAGETKNPRRNVPIAVIGALVGCSAFYVLIQIVAYGTQPAIAEGAGDAPWSARPLADAAQTFLGAPGATLMSLGACISMMGFCVGSALASPRFLGVLAEDRLFPRWLASVHPRFGSPYVAIAATVGLTLLASQILDFDSLVDLANVAVTLQYVGTCAAVIWLRVKKPHLERTYRVPGGAFLMPAVGIGVCALLLSQAAMAEFVFAGVVVVIGAMLAAVSALVGKPARG